MTDVLIGIIIGAALALALRGPLERWLDRRGKVLPWNQAGRASLTTQREKCKWHIK